MKAYDDAKSFHDGLAAVKRWGKWGYIDLEGKEVTPFIYDVAEDFNEGYARVKIHGRWGFINPEGKGLTSGEYFGQHCNKYEKAEAAQNEKEGAGE